MHASLLGALSQSDCCARDYECGRVEVLSYLVDP
jgi:hypothetical protein